jgi:hypothetical protein
MKTTKEKPFVILARQNRDNAIWRVHATCKTEEERDKKLIELREKIRGFAFKGPE